MLNVPEICHKKSTLVNYIRTPIEGNNVNEDLKMRNNNKKTLTLMEIIVIFKASVPM